MSKPNTKLKEVSCSHQSPNQVHAGWYLIEQGFKLLKTAVLLRKT